MKHLNRFKLPILIALCVGILAGASLLGVWIYLKSLYKTGTIKSFKLSQSSILYSQSGQVLDYYFKDQFRLLIPIDKIDNKAVKFIVFLEDEKFFTHKGLDTEQIMFSIKTNLKRKKYARGASTITQQLVKNLLLTPEKTLSRKAKELYITQQVENELTKNEILELYLNAIEFGPGIYGIMAACIYYFDKSAQSLTFEEALFLGLILPAPKYFNPIHNPGRIEVVKEKYLKLFDRLVYQKILTKQDKPLYEQVNFDLLIKRLERTHPLLDKRNYIDKPKFYQFLEAYLVKKHGPKLYSAGLNFTLKASFNLDALILIQNPKYYFCLFNDNSQSCDYLMLFDSELDMLAFENSSDGIIKSGDLQSLNLDWIVRTGKP